MTSLTETAAWLRLNSDDPTHDWRSACEVELLRVWPEFHQSHPYLVDDPEPWKPRPEEGAAYPSLFEAYLYARTGVA